MEPIGALTWRPGLEAGHSFNMIDRYLVLEIDFAFRLRRCRIPTKPQMSQFDWLRCTIRAVAL